MNFKSDYARARAALGEADANVAKLTLRRDELSRSLDAARADVAKAENAEASVLTGDASIDDCRGRMEQLAIDKQRAEARADQFERLIRVQDEQIRKARDQVTEAEVAACSVQRQFFNAAESDAIEKLRAALRKPLRELVIAVGGSEYHRVYADRPRDAERYWKAVNADTLMHEIIPTLVDELSSEPGFYKGIDLDGTSDTPIPVRAAKSVANAAVTHSSVG